MTRMLHVAVVGSGPLAESFKRLLETAEGLKALTLEESIQHDKHVDAIIETTNLDLDQKKRMLHEVESSISPETLILSTCLGVTATETASWLTHPQRLVGFAAFAALDQADLVEVAPALQTDPLYVEQTTQLWERLSKQVEVVDDQVGLVYPRILSMIINEAAFALMEGIASAEDIDIAMQKGTNYPLGPLAWADEIGIDDVYAVLAGLYRELAEDRYRPAPLLRKMVYAGWLGKKSGKGFYSHINEAVKEPVG